MSENKNRTFQNPWQHALKRLIKNRGFHVQLNLSATLFILCL